MGNSQRVIAAGGGTVRRGRNVVRAGLAALGLVALAGCSMLQPAPVREADWRGRPATAEAAGPQTCVDDAANRAAAGPVEKADMAPALASTIVPADAPPAG